MSDSKPWPPEGMEPDPWCAECGRKSEQCPHMPLKPKTVDSKPKTTDDPAESYMSAWPKSAEDVSGHYHPGPELKPLSEKEWTGIMRRAIDSAIDNVVSQDRIVLVAEVRRLRAENARLQSELAETRGHLADKEHREEDLVRENARLQSELDLSRQLHKGDVAVKELTQRRYKEVLAENTRQQSALTAQQDKLIRLADENARQAETIARLREALEYASGWFAALPGEAENKLREALKETP